MTRAAAIVSLAAGLLTAQAQPPTFKSRVDLVEVDVVVVDRDGNPVGGLRASDFVLRDRGKPQGVATFDEVSRTPPMAAMASLPAGVRRDVADNQTAQADRLVVMVVDDLHIYKERTERARDIAGKVLADLGPASSMAVLFTSGDHSTQVTADQAVLREAIETLRGRQSWRRPHPAVDKQKGDRIDPEDSSQTALDKVNANQLVKPQDFFDNLTQYKLLQDAAKMLGSGGARRKAFVLISEGIGKDLGGLFGAMRPAGDAPQGGADYAAGNLGGLTVMPPATYHDFALLDAMESMRRSNVATYAIDPRGKVNSQDLARECFPAPSTGVDPCSEGVGGVLDWVSPVRQAQHGLEIMSAASGGFAVTNTDDFTSGLKRIVDDLDHYYLLGFYPADPKGKGYRPLDVQIPGRPDLKLRFRHGYMPGGPPAAPKNANELVALSAGILPATSLPLRLAAVTTPGEGASAHVVLMLEVSVPRAQVEEPDGRLRDTVKYEVLVVDEKKARVRSLAGLEAAFTLSANSAAGPAPDVATYDVAEVVDLAPGRYEFRVSATSAKLKQGGSVYLPVQVPDFQRGSELGGLAIGYADGPRVPVAPRRVGPFHGAARMATPPRPPLPFPPSLDRVFTSHDTLRVYAEGSARGDGRPTVTLEVLDRSGKVVRSPSPSYAVTETVRIDTLVPLAGLAPGPYVLRLTLTVGAKPPAVRESGVLVR